MKADAFPVGQILGEKCRFEVPVYQRTYKWDEGKQLPKFLGSLERKAQARLDGLQAGGAMPGVAHYMGALILQPRPYEFGRVQTSRVVDGQQRLTTFQLFLAALREVARRRERQEMAGSLRPHLFNDPPMQDPEAERYKLVPTRYDRALFREIVEQTAEELRKAHPDSFFQNGKPVKGRAHLLLRAYFYLLDGIEAFVGAEGADENEAAKRLDALGRALLEDFRIVVIRLDEGDDAQVIFETLNSTGEPLAAMDLVRNDLFHRAAKMAASPNSVSATEAQAALESRWAVFEDQFWKDSGTQGRVRKPRIDFFLAHALGAEAGFEASLDELYADYQRWSRENGLPSALAELETLARYAPAYRTLADPQPQPGDLAHLARDLRLWDVTTAYPLVLVVAASDAPNANKVAIYALIRSYIVRRALCQMKTGNYNKVFLAIATKLRHEGVQASNAARAFADLQGDVSLFPDDAMLIEAFKSRQVYGRIAPRRLEAILVALERASWTNHDEKGAVADGLTIEHILPVNWAQHWPLSDGRYAPTDGTFPDELMREAAHRRDEAKHTLGNLTLLTPSKNPALSNFPFTGAPEQNKREKFACSLLKLNQEIAAEGAWGEDAIARRADRLSKLASKIWPAPCQLLDTATV